MNYYFITKCKNERKSKGGASTRKSIELKSVLGVWSFASPIMEEWTMKKLGFLCILTIISLLLAGGSAMAATSVSWTNPADGSSFTVGTNVQPEGQASATGTIGTGLDLALVLDSSGSMTTRITVGGTTQSRGAWQKQFAKDLVASLPTATTSVAVTEFDSSASTPQTLLPLTPSANITTINTAIDSVNQFGGTNIGAGINAAKNELTSSRADPARDQMMVVFSDGSSSGNPPEAADSAVTAGVEAVHSVGLPGHNVATMQAIVDGVDDTYNTSDDHGTYTDGSNLQNLINIFGGGGNIVDIARVEIQLHDGTMLNSADGDFGVGPLGNFQVPSPWSMLNGANTFEATAFGTDQTQASAQLTLYGTDNGQQPVPEPGTVLLLGTGLLGLAAYGRKKLKNM